MIEAQQVRELIKKHFWAMSDESSLNSGNESVLPEDARVFFEDYFSDFGIDPVNFNFRKYFPNTGLRFLPNAILPDYLKTDHHAPEDLTVSMLISSAKAGRWLY